MNKAVACLTKALALHRAGGVENQENLARLALTADRRRGRRQHHQRVVVVAHLFGEYGNLVAGFAWQLPVENKVAIHHYRIFQQLNAVLGGRQSGC